MMKYFTLALLSFFLVGEGLLAQIRPIPPRPTPRPRPVPAPRPIPERPIEIPREIPRHLVSEVRLGLMSERVERTNINVRGRIIPVSFDVVGDWGILEGDILLGNAHEITRRYFEKSASIEEYGLRWPGGIVPYTIDSTLPNQSRVLDAIQHWEDNTLVRFVERTSQKNFVRFVKSTGCSSYVGMQDDGAQVINLGDGCSTGNTIHEIGHAIGFWHTQSRSDRDDSVEVHWDNIQAGRDHNFQTYVERDFDGQDFGAYDLGSIMHYGSYFFSRNGEATLTELDGSIINAQRVGLSATDRGSANNLYREFTRDDCVSVNHNNLRFVFRNNKWIIADGSHFLFSFNQFNEAHKTLQILRNYQIRYSCFVGRPGPSLQYVLTWGKQAPTGNRVSGEDCIPFNRNHLDVIQVNGRYKLKDNRSWLVDFGSNIQEAYKAYRLVFDEGFTKQCFVGRPGASFTYWKK